MALTATCTNCGKSYQAPDSMAGKSVRCKDCGTVFSVKAPARPDVDEDGLPNLDALSESISSPTGAQTAVGMPAQGKSAQGKPAKSSGPASSGAAMPSFMTGGRPSEIPAYGGAREVDQYVPPALLIVSLVVGLLVIKASSGQESEAIVWPTRFGSFVLALVVCVAPLTFLGVKLASAKARVQLPRGAFFRTLSAASLGALLAAMLYYKGGAALFPLILGSILGLGLMLGAMLVTLRLFPNELPIFGAFAGGGYLAGTGVGLGALLLLNLISNSIVNTSGGSLAVSPVALGMHWDMPAPDASSDPTAVARSTPARPTPADSTTADPARPATTAPAVDGSDASALSDLLTPLPLPADVQAAGLVKAMYLPPVDSGFTRALRPLRNDASTVALIRGAGNAQGLEVWSTSTWQPIDTVRLSGSQSDLGNIAVSPDGRTVAVLANFPRVGIELLRHPGSSTDVRRIDLTNSGHPELIGFIDDQRLLVLRSVTQSEHWFDLIDVSTTEGRTVSTPLMLRRAGATTNLVPGEGRQRVAVPASLDVAYLPGRVGSTAESVTARFAFGRDAADNPLPLRLSAAFNVNPSALVLSPDDAYLAAVLDNGQFAQLVVYQVKAVRLNNVTIPASSSAREIPLGALSDLGGSNWPATYHPTAAWLDERHLLVYGTRIIDVSTGKTVGTTGLSDVIGVYSAGRSNALLVRRSGDNGQLVLAQFNLPGATTKPAQ